MRSVRSYLVAMAVLLVALFCAAGALLVHQLDSFARKQTEQQLLDTTRALSLVIDGQLERYQAMLLTLRASEALQRDDWPALDREARAALSDPDVWIVMGDRQGRQLINTRLPPGAPLPSRAVPNRIWPTLDQGRSRVCDLTQGGPERQVVCVDVPVMRDGRAAYHLSVVFRPKLLQRILDAQKLRGGALASIIDRRGVVIWRNVTPARFVGASASPPMRATMARASEGVTRAVSLDGIPTLVAFSRSPVSGWTFAVGVPQRELAAGGRQALRYGLAGSVLLLVLAAGVGVIASRRVTAALGHLGAATHRIRAGQPPAFQPSGFEEIDQVGAVLDAAIAERDATQERFNLAQEVGGIGSWEWDLVRDEGRVSESYKQMHGLAHVPGPLKIAQVRAVIHPEDLPAYTARTIAALRTFEPSTNEYRVLHPDGSIHWISAKGRALLGPGGRAVAAVGIVMDVTERKAAEERLRLLTREVDHRANNLMAVIQGAVSLSRADDAQELRQIIVGRVAALARAHQLLADSRWKGADLRRLIEEEMLPFTLGDGRRVEIDGQAVPLPPAAAQAVAMVLHELATNAAKHGALSTPEGRVRIQWRTEAGRLHARWEESGGPPVTTPDRRGFGTTILQRAFAGALRGEIRLDWRPEGLACELELPLAQRAGPEAPA